jgi:hypothetical protein
MNCCLLANAFLGGTCSYIDIDVLWLFFEWQVALHWVVRVEICNPMLLRQCSKHSVASLDALND